MGIYMLPAFILGFWCIWSGSRDVKSLWESFSMTIIFIIIKGLMEFKTPDFDNEMMVTWGLLFLYIVVVLEAIDRFSRTVAINMTIATLGAIGYYFLSSHLFSEAGQTMVKGWIG